MNEKEAGKAHLIKNKKVYYTNNLAYFYAK